MAKTYKAIATVTVGSGGASSIDFSSIPTSYTDLILKVSSRTTDSTNTSEPIIIRFNDSTSNLSARALYGDGSSGSSLTRASNSNVAWTDTDVNTASTFGNAEWYITNYAGSNNKSVLNDAAQENNGTGAIVSLSGILWSNTAAINKITLVTGNGYNFKQYSTATLYGIKNS